MVSSTESSCSVQRGLILQITAQNLNYESALPAVPCQVSTEKRALSVHGSPREDSATSENYVYCCHGLGPASSQLTPLSSLPLTGWEGESGEKGKTCGLK